LLVTFILATTLVAVEVPASAENCATPPPMPTGQYICEYGSPTLFVWQDGRREYWVAGSDKQAYFTREAYPYSGAFSTWRSIGGILWSHPWLETSDFQTYVVIRVRGVWNVQYCQRWTSGIGWRGWYNC
jgi:hypothetical protein